MNTVESVGTTDYKYYPLAYPTMAFTTIAAEACKDYISAWAVLIDKTKFLTGVRDDDYGHNKIAIITVGF